MSSAPLRLAFVTTYDARDVSSWSGTPYHVAKALEGQGLALEYIGPLRTRFGRLSRVRSGAQGRLGRRYMYDRDPRVLRHYARQVEARLRGLDVDAVFSPGTIPVAHLHTHLPIVTWTDATFAGMVDYYPSFSGLSEQSVHDGHTMERAALAHAAAAVYSSEWAARSAVEEYGADPAKVHVVPFGANLETVPSQGEVATLVEQRQRRECRLLFIGVDWFRKGGDLALAVAQRLVESGIDARLAVMGCKVPKGSGSELVDPLGFIAKSTQSGQATIARILGESHFLCLPSRADCTPVVLCEASAYGLPSVSVRTGGIESVVRQGKNGYLFGLDSFVEEAAGSIARCMSAYDDTYVPLAMSSREEYQTRLNWTIASKKLVEHVSRLVADRR